MRDIDLRVLVNAFIMDKTYIKTELGIHNDDVFEELIRATINLSFINLVGIPFWLRIQQYIKANRIIICQVKNLVSYQLC